MSLSQKQIDMMMHAYGADSKNPGFRTHYCTQLDDPDILNLQHEGMFSDPVGMGTVGENCGIFHLTDRAIEMLKSSKPIYVNRGIHHLDITIEVSKDEVKVNGQ